MSLKYEPAAVTTTQRFSGFAEIRLVHLVSGVGVGTLMLGFWVSGWGCGGQGGAGVEGWDGAWLTVR